MAHALQNGHLKSRIVCLTAVPQLAITEDRAADERRSVSVLELESVAHGTVQLWAGSSLEKNEER